MSVKNLVVLGLAATAAATKSCRVIPGDAGWPSASQWAGLNKTLSGRLIAAVPQAYVCHDSGFGPYNASACSYIQSTWNETKLTQYVDVHVLIRHVVEEARFC